MCCAFQQAFVLLLHSLYRTKISLKLIRKFCLLIKVAEDSMANRDSSAYEAVFFLDNKKVTRHMLYSEFEALLDGLVALPDYTDVDAKAVYVVISKSGKVSALVFFVLYFDEDGRADASWNIPVERLAEVSARGPDLGGGPIRLACRGQCAINWHQNDLWDPDMTPGSNDFLILKKAVEENRLHFGFQKAEAEVPVLSKSSLGAEPLLESINFDSDQEKRLKLARLLKEQRLRIRTLESSHEQSIGSADREKMISLHAYKNEIQVLNQTVEQLKLINEKLKDKLTSRNDQFLSLQDKVSDQAALVAKLEVGLKNASAGERLSLERQKMEAEIVLLKEQLDRKDFELSNRGDREEQLRAELEELSESIGGGIETSSIIKRLKELEVVYVVYHPGAGHINMTSDDILRYVENPNAFIASKCFVTEGQYLAWLEHFDNPVCRHKNEQGHVCALQIDKVSIPSEFDQGVDDRCERHQANDV
mgnify:CR=1 FL=1|tara:strand:+ start:597 stop:2027 length:1431 start_codon:yes stop_codon:yes gene_type:complete